MVLTIRLTGDLVLTELRFDLLANDDLVLATTLAIAQADVPMFRLCDEHERALASWRNDATQGNQGSLVGIDVRRGYYRDPQKPQFRLVLENWYAAWLRVIWRTFQDPLLFVATDEPDTILPIFREFGPISPTFGGTA